MYGKTHNDMPQWLKEELFGFNTNDENIKNIIEWSTVNIDNIPSKFQHFLTSKYMPLLFIPCFWILIPLAIYEQKRVEKEYTKSYLIIYNNKFVIHYPVSYGSSFRLMHYEFSYLEKSITDFVIKIPSNICNSNLTGLSVIINNEESDIIIYGLDNIDNLCETLKKTMKENRHNTKNNVKEYEQTKLNIVNHVILNN